MIKLQSPWDLHQASPPDPSRQTNIGIKEVLPQDQKCLDMGDECGFKTRGLSGQEKSHKQKELKVPDPEVERKLGQEQRDSEHELRSVAYSETQWLEKSHRLIWD